MQNLFSEVSTKETAKNVEIQAVKSVEINTINEISIVEKSKKKGTKKAKKVSNWKQCLATNKEAKKELNSFNSVRTAMIKGHFNQIANGEQGYPIDVINILKLSKKADNFKTLAPYLDSTITKLGYSAHKLMISFRKNSVEILAKFDENLRVSRITKMNK